MKGPWSLKSGLYKLTSRKHQWKIGWPAPRPIVSTLSLFNFKLNQRMFIIIININSNAFKNKFNTLSVSFRILNSMGHNLIKYQFLIISTNFLSLKKSKAELNEQLNDLEKTHIFLHFLTSHLDATRLWPAIIYLDRNVCNWEINCVG